MKFSSELRLICVPYSWFSFVGWDIDGSYYINDALVICLAVWIQEKVRMLTTCLLNMRVLNGNLWLFTLTSQSAGYFIGDCTNASSLACMLCMLYVYIYALHTWQIAHSNAVNQCMEYIDHFSVLNSPCGIIYILIVDFLFIYMGISNLLLLLC